MPKSPRQPKKQAKYPPHSGGHEAQGMGREEDPLEGIALREEPEGTGPRSKVQSPKSEESDSSHPQPSTLTPYFSAPGTWLYQNNCLEVMDAIAAKHPEGRFDMIFADPPYFLSNGGITCHAGKMVSVHKGDWDKSRGPEWNHEFNTEWLRRCQREP